MDQAFAIYLGLHLGDYYVFVFDVESQPIKRAHVSIGNPHQGKFGDDVSAPALIKHLVAREKQEQRRHIVTEAVFACKEIEKFPHQKRPASFALLLAVLSGLSKYFFVSDRPRDTSDGQRKQQQEGELVRQRNGKNAGHHVDWSITLRNPQPGEHRSTNGQPIRRWPYSYAQHVSSSH